MPNTEIHKKGKNWKFILGVTIVVIGGWITLAEFFQWQHNRKMAKVGGIFFGDRISDAIHDPNQNLITMAIFGAITFGGWYLIKNSKSGSNSNQTDSQTSSTQLIDTISVSCPGCGADYNISASNAGRKFRCQKCRTIIGG